ncbi:MAG: TlpA family protein disulfide reductase [Dehalococcoidia bacterium]|nr:MAG: TlpA family protein disulfide reductase [Dehalococcoidia bacterium]
MKSLLPIILAIVIMIIPIAGCGGASPTACPKIGDKAPDITFIGMDGKNVNLSDYAGKPVILNTWNLSCIECKREMPFFQEVYFQYKEKGLVLLSINTLDGIGNSTKDFLSKNNYTFTVLYDKNQDIYKKFCCPKNADPYTIFIGTDGIIKGFKIGGFIGTDDLITEVNKILPAN